MVVGTNRMTFPSDPAAMRETPSTITTGANLLLERIHNTRKRMPVMLRQEDEVRWLEELGSETSHQHADEQAWNGRHPNDYPMVHRFTDLAKSAEQHYLASDQ